MYGVSKVFRKLFLVIHSNLLHYSVPSGPLYISDNCFLACRQSLFFHGERGMLGYHADTPITIKAEAILKADSHSH